LAPVFAYARTHIGANGEVIGHCVADESAAPKDSDRALTVVRIPNEMAHRFGTAIIDVTHDEKIIPTFRRIYHIRDGRTYAQAGVARAA
jgi:putative ABC transport system ATP-binding protein